MTMTTPTRRSSAQPAPSARPALPVLLACALVVLAALPGAAGTTSPSVAGPEANPCRPYPENPDPVTQAWCTAKGIGNATVTFFENVWNGNYTTVEELRHGVEDWLTTVQSCADPSDPDCPALLLLLRT